MMWQAEKNGEFTLYADGRPLLSAAAAAEEAGSGETIDSRHAALVSAREADGGLILTFESPSGLVLTETLTAAGSSAAAMCELRRRDGAPVRTRSLTPLIAHGLRDETPYLWRDLEARMLLVPYDNDMWMRYETAPLRAGRRSHDVTVLLREDTREGLLIGALDFDTWKNAIACPGTDARILEARCGRGACGEDTHDSAPHGTVEGPCVRSSRFRIAWGPDWRTLLEDYGDALKEERAPLAWEGGVPFGFNSYAGLAATLNADNFAKSGSFVHDSLMPLGFENRGETWINLDGGWQRIPEADRLRLLEEMHRRGQKAGIYDAPFACFGPLDREIPLMPGHTFSEIALRDAQGKPLPRVDGAVPLDVTHPLWLQWTGRKAEKLIEWGYDYLKIDFLSHGGMEGRHADPAVSTGRQALCRGYQALTRLYDAQRMGRPFFISLSIAPLFPFGYGTARRFSCDAFGLAEDVEYVLNAQTYGWWAAGRLYCFNDADHIVLLRSFCMTRESEEGEARARYTSAAAAGSMMLLSEDYDRPGARERTLRIAGNADVNALARRGLVFRPADAAGAATCPVFTFRTDAECYAALFCWREGGDTLRLSLARCGLPEGTYTDLWTGQSASSEQDTLTWAFAGPDAALLRWTGSKQGGM